MNMERRRIERNKREQKRVKLQCKAFKELQELLPNSNQKKRTKIQILQDASDYIRYLKLKLQKVEEKGTEDSLEDCQARPSCVFAKKGQEVSYLTHPVQSQASVSFAASPSYYEACPEMDCIRHLTSPIWFVPNISHSDTEDQLDEDLEYFINTTWECGKKERNMGSLITLPWFEPY